MAKQKTLPFVTQITANGSTGLGDVATKPFNDGTDYAVLCADAKTDSAAKVKQFWTVARTIDADIAGMVQAGPDFHAVNWPYKWTRTL